MLKWPGRPTQPAVGNPPPLGQERLQLTQLRRRCKQRARVRCAQRLAHFLQEHNEANLVVMAVRKFKSRVVLLQR